MSSSYRNTALVGVAAAFALAPSVVGAAGYDKLYGEQGPAEHQLYADTVKGSMLPAGAMSARSGATEFSAFEAVPKDTKAVSRGEQKMDRWMPDPAATYPDGARIAP